MRDYDDEEGNGEACDAEFDRNQEDYGSRWGR